MTDHVSIIDPPLEPREELSEAEDIVTAGDFWPPLSISHFRKVQRAEDAINDTRIRAAIQSGIQSAFLDLSEWAKEQRDAGHATLNDVPAIDEIDGKSPLVWAWERAIFSLAKAELVESLKDYDATGAGERNTEFVDDSIIQLRRDATHAIRDLKGRPRTTVELI